MKNKLFLFLLFILLLFFTIPLVSPAFLVVRAQSRFDKPEPGQSQYFEACCGDGLPNTVVGCRAVDPNSGWRGVCATNVDCSKPAPSCSASACSKACGGGTQVVTCTNICGGVVSSTTQSCNTQACVTPTLIPTSTPPTATIIPSVTPTVGSCPRKGQGDADCDGSVNGVDYSIWLNSQCRPGIGQSCNSYQADFNQDGKIDDDDYQIWLNNRA